MRSRRADLDEAAARLAALLREEHADVLTVYDDHGGYGHPDHIQVHRVGVRAAELAGTPRVYESTMNRDFIQALMAARADEMPDDRGRAGRRVDGRLRLAGGDHHDDRRRQRLRRSEARRDGRAREPDPGRLVLPALPPDAFREAFGHEWFIRRDRPDIRENWLFDDLK